MNHNKNVVIFGGGTVSHVTPHLAISAPAYGSTARKLQDLVKERFGDTVNIDLILSRMASSVGETFETNEDLDVAVKHVINDIATKVVFFSTAVCDWDVGTIVQDGKSVETGKYGQRLESRSSGTSMSLKPSEKIVSQIRKTRKDIFLVAFKTTAGATKQEMYEKGLRLCKEASANLVLVNDVKTRWNMIVTPEEAAYSETDDRNEVLKELVDMAYYRSHLTFTRSTVIDGKPVSWNDERVPESLRQAVNFCIKHDAYKPFGDSTVGHFAHKLSDTEFLTSIRKSNFNKLNEVGLVYVRTDGPDTVIAYGSKPSVGGQSQRIIFNDHKGMDCVLHFHSPLRKNNPDKIPVVSQREVECGSHQCGKNTSDNLKQFGNLKAVMLHQHGPNIVFNKNINPQEVVDFVERNFDLTQKTGGYNLK